MDKVFSYTEMLSYVDAEQIDRLLLAASRLIRNDQEFQRLMIDLEGSP